MDCPRTDAPGLSPQGRSVVVLEVALLPVDVPVLFHPRTPGGPPLVLTSWGQPRAVLSWCRGPLHLTGSQPRKRRVAVHCVRGQASHFLQRTEFPAGQNCPAALKEPALSFVRVSPGGLLPWLLCTPTAASAPWTTRRCSPLQGRRPSAATQAPCSSSPQAELSHTQAVAACGPESGPWVPRRVPGSAGRRSWSASVPCGARLQLAESEGPVQQHWWASEWVSGGLTRLSGRDTPAPGGPLALSF